MISARKAAAIYVVLRRFFVCTLIEFFCITSEQTADTCSAFPEYIEKTSDSDKNLANGVKEALIICLNEMKDYLQISPVSYVDEDETDDMNNVLESCISKAENLNV